MRKIFKKAIESAYGSNPALFNAISFLGSEEQERFIEIALDCHITDDELPIMIIRNNKTYELVSTNYIKDEIIASYIDTDVRYFATEEEANEYYNTGNYKYSKSSSSACTEYPYRGEYTSKKTTWFSYNTWMNSEVVVKDNE